jgi:toxin ParE1/3/4
MARVVISDLADSDTEEVLDYLSLEAGPRIAARYAEEFERLYDRLAEFHDSGSARPALGPYVRIGVVLPYIVIYEHAPDDELVIVLRIVHGHMRLSGRMLRRC